MPIEYEYQFYNYNKENIISKLLQNGGIYKGTFLFKVQEFYHPLAPIGAHIRVRDEGYRITMTYKLPIENSNFMTEYEIIINNFADGINFFLQCGFVKKIYYEKIREIWNICEGEIVFDKLPNFDEYMEIESKTEDGLNTMVKTLF